MAWCKPLDNAVLHCYRCPSLFSPPSFLSGLASYLLQAPPSSTILSALSTAAPLPRAVPRS